MIDIANSAFEKFFKERTRSLNERFPGWYRALVVETNDPLNMGRVKFKCPDMHDWGLKTADCPWAVPAPNMGGENSGHFTHPCIEDWIWITFEKQHPYGPIWCGFATPTRRGMYQLPFVHIDPSSYVDSTGSLKRSNKSFDEEYLPKDGRPMSSGWVDRYGNADISSGVGFFPGSHAVAPSPAGSDPLNNKDFEVKKAQPTVNDPDRKYQARISRYGNIILMGDQGYYWRRANIGDDKLGEFFGYPTTDEDDVKYESKRWLYIQKLLNENKSSTSRSTREGSNPVPGSDQRRIQLSTRYGHKIECRDVGWAQSGPIKSLSRRGEYGDPALLSLEEKNDQRWIKIRTKGGMLFQAYDKGFHPAEDNYVKRKLIDEQGTATEQEDKHWNKKDARWIRLVTRYGLKMVLDDRGSDDKRAEKADSPRGNGILIKGRRSPGAKDSEARGNPRGFYWEFNENNKANHTTWGTPMGLAIEMNDRYQYTLLSASMGTGWSTKWQGIKENEFLGKPLMSKNPEKNSHHIKLDHDNEYIRVKTRGGRGTKPKRPSNPSNVRSGEINQGFEARDGAKGDGPWVEIVDCQRRGMWFSKRYRIGIWRSAKQKRMYMWMDETRRRMVLYNNESNGKIILYCNSDIEIFAQRNLKLTAGQNITMNAGGSIRMQSGGGARLTLSGRMFTNRPVGIGGLPATRSTKPELPENIEPTDRGKTYNEPFENCPKEEIEHRI
jgi:hypothetical protein